MQKLNFRAITSDMRGRLSPRSIRGAMDQRSLIDHAASRAICVASLCRPKWRPGPALKARPVINESCPRKTGEP
jgi:hypothetical protein